MKLAEGNGEVSDRGLKRPRRDEEKKRRKRAVFRSTFGEITLAEKRRKGDRHLSCREVMRRLSGMPRIVREGLEDGYYHVLNRSAGLIWGKIGLQGTDQEGMDKHEFEPDYDPRKDLMGLGLFGAGVVLLIALVTVG